MNLEQALARIEELEKIKKEIEEEIKVLEDQICRMDEADWNNQI